MRRKFVAILANDDDQPIPTPAHWPRTAQEFRAALDRRDATNRAALHERLRRKMTEDDLDRRQADWPWGPTSVEQNYRVPMRSECRRDHEPNCRGIDWPPVIKTTRLGRWWWTCKRLFTTMRAERPTIKENP